MRCRHQMQREIWRSKWPRLKRWIKVKEHAPEPTLPEKSSTSSIRDPLEDSPTCVWDLGITSPSTLKTSPALYYRPGIQTPPVSRVQTPSRSDPPCKSNHIRYDRHGNLPHSSPRTQTLRASECDSVAFGWSMLRIPISNLCHLSRRLHPRQDAKS